MSEQEIPAQCSQAEVDALREEVARLQEMEERLTSLGVRAVNVADGKATISFDVATEIMQLLAGSARAILDGKGAVNYVEMLMGDGSGLFFTVTVQRTGRPTPHEKRVEAEREVARLRKLIERGASPLVPPSGA